MPPAVSMDGFVIREFQHRSSPTKTLQIKSGCRRSRPNVIECSGFFPLNMGGNAGFLHSSHDYGDGYFLSPEIIMKGIFQYVRKNE